MSPEAICISSFWDVAVSLSIADSRQWSAVGSHAMRWGRWPLQPQWAAAASPASLLQLHTPSPSPPIPSCRALPLILPHTPGGKTSPPPCSSALPLGRSPSAWPRKSNIPYKESNLQPIACLVRGVLCSRGVVSAVLSPPWAALGTALRSALCLFVLELRQPMHSGIFNYLQSAVVMPAQCWSRGEGGGLLDLGGWFCAILFLK